MQNLSHIFLEMSQSIPVLASQGGLEVMRAREWVTEWVSVSIDFTDVTLVSDDTHRRLYWCDPDDPD